MNKHVLSVLTLMLFGLGSIHAQTEFFVGDCATATGGYEASFAETNGWGVPDMTDPSNLITGGMVLAEDSLACGPLTNATEINGNICVVYRGDCQFGTKAMNCQDAGATGVMIINHSPGVIPMGGGDDGPFVTIPVWMISNADGAALYDDIVSGNITEDCVIAGNMNGYFENNLRLIPGKIRRPNTYGQLEALNQDDSEFSVETGAWVYNFGSSTEEQAALNITVEVNDTEVYNETSEPVSIASGDSAFITLPTYSESSYASGRYTMTYNVAGSVSDDFTADNSTPADFHMGDTYSYSRLNEENKAWPTNYTSLVDPVGERNYCIFFTDPHASRVAVTGFDFSGTHFTEEITDMEVDIVIYEWDDDYDGLNTTFDALSELESETYTFEEGDDDQIISLPFDTPIELEDDLNYAFCLRHNENELQLGFDNKTDYTENVSVSQVPVFPYFDENQAFPLMFGEDTPPAFSVQTNNLVGIGEFQNDVEVTPFPNPVAEMLTIPVGQKSLGKTELRIFDIEGRLVSAQNVRSRDTEILVNVTGISNGSYVFNLRYEDGAQSTFNVVISR